MVSLRGHVTDSQLLDVLCYGVFGRHVTDSHLLDALCYGGGDVTTYYPSSWCMYAYYYYYYMMARNSKGTDGGQRQLTNPVVVKV